MEVFIWVARAEISTDNYEYYSFASLGKKILFYNEGESKEKN